VVCVKGCRGRLGAGCLLILGTWLGLAESGREVDGWRVIAIAGRGEALVIARALRERHPDRLKYLKGLLRDDSEEVEEIGAIFDTRDAERALGSPWLSYEKSVVDTAKVLERYLDKLWLSSLTVLPNFHPQAQYPTRVNKRSPATVLDSTSSPPSLPSSQPSFHKLHIWFLHHASCTALSSAPLLIPPYSRSPASYVPYPILSQTTPWRLRTFRQL